MRRWWVLVLLAACTDPTGIPGATPFEPLSTYAEWWTEAQGCVEAAAPLERVRWYTVPALPSGRTGYERIGMWESPHTIYLVRGWEDDQKTVQHEMLHDLLEGDSTHQHPCFGSLDLL